MQFSVGDKVIHPQYGPGRITGIAGSELSEADRRYYVIEIPRKGLTVHTPVGMADALGLRHAMSECRSRRILSMLGGRPHPLPEDFRARQEAVWSKLEAGHVVDLAAVARDLSWRQRLTHLTKKDADQLRRALDMLTEEIALASGDTAAEVREQIGAALASATEATGVEGGE
ncbi:MAG TPA: CarD family transcriptional regulator [Anaerolineae bacterium]|nr:CarD family transcriptional regulator [Anaerolineae bacterium]